MSRRLLLGAFILALLVPAMGQAYDRIVMLEIFTNVQCPPCASNDPTFKQFIINNRDNLSAIRYHMSWPGYDPWYTDNPTDANAKRSTYGVNGVPHARIDGSEPGTATYTMSELQNAFNTRIAIPSPLQIELSGQIDPSLAMGTLTVTLTVDEPLSTDARLNVGLIESECFWNGYSNYDWHDEVMHDMLTSGWGDMLDPFNGPYPEVREFTFDFFIDPDWQGGDTAGGSPDWLMCDMVAFVQNFAGNPREVYQSAWIDMEDFELITVDVVDAGLAIEPGIGPNSPNPFNPRTFIPVRMEQRGELELGIYSTDGRLVRTLASTIAPEGVSTFEWDGMDDIGRSVASGVYYVKMVTNGMADYRAITLLK